MARLSLHLSKCHIVGNHMSWLNYVIRIKSHVLIYNNSSETSRCGSSLLSKNGREFFNKGVFRICLLKRIEYLLISRCVSF